MTGGSSLGIGAVFTFDVMFGAVMARTAHSPCDLDCLLHRLAVTGRSDALARSKESVDAAAWRRDFVRQDAYAQLMDK